MNVGGHDDEPDALAVYLLKLVIQDSQNNSLGVIQQR
jgi:hypothetical protein